MLSYTKSKITVALSFNLSGVRNEIKRLRVQGQYTFILYETIQNTIKGLGFVTMALHIEHLEIRAVHETTDKAQLSSHVYCKL
jgi:mannose/fructose/N-acetylgalactosamine-specific phosphotransferase system component IIB